MFNKAQPIRPDYSVDGVPLLYRTQPKNITRIPKFYSLPQILSALRLYRASRAGDIPNQVAIAELYDFAMFGITDIVSKSNLGSTVVHSVLYEPRKLINRKNIKIMVTYRFLHPLDLQYGLEWQICCVIYSWLYKNGEFPKDKEKWQPKMEEILEEIAFSPDYKSLYEDPIIEDANEIALMEPDWKKIISLHPERTVKNQPRPKDFSQV